MAQEKKTTKANKNAEPVIKPEPKEMTSDYLMTGLSDYGFWSQQVKKEVAARKEPDPPFRRGRIWC